MVLFYKSIFGNFKVKTNIQQLRRFDLRLSATQKEIYRYLQPVERLFGKFQLLSFSLRKKVVAFSKVTLLYIKKGERRLIGF